MARTTNRKPRANGTGAALPAFKASLAVLTETEATAKAVRDAAERPLSDIDTALTQLECWGGLVQLIMDRGFDAVERQANLELVEPILRQHIAATRDAFNAAHDALVCGKAGAR